MFSYNMESDLKNYNKSSVRDIVYHNLFQKQKLMTKSTFTTFQKRFTKIMKEKDGSKAFLIKLNKDLDNYKPSTEGYKKEDGVFKKAEIPTQIKSLTSNKLKEIKKEEQKMIEQGRSKLKNFLHDNHKTVSFSCAVFIPFDPKVDKYKGNNAIFSNGIHWKPLSRSDIGDLKSYYLSYETVKAEFLYKQIKSYGNEIIKTLDYNEYNGKDGNFRGLITEFTSFSDLDEFINFQSVSDAFLLKIFDLSVQKMKNTETNYFSDEAFDDIANTFLSNKYTSCDTTKNIYSSSYVNKTYKPTSCWLSLLLEVYRVPFQKHYKKFELSYQYIHDIIGDGALKKEGNGYSFKQVKKFFEKYNLKLSMYDNHNNLVEQYIPNKENRDIRPNSLSVVFHNNHIYLLNNELSSLSHKKKAGLIIKEPSDKFYLAEKKELENDTRIINSYSDLEKIINDKKITGTVHLIYQKSCFDLWYDLLTKMKYEANIRMRDSRLDFSGLTLRNINDKNIIIQSYYEDGVVVDKVFEDSKMFHNYIEKKNNVLNKLLNKNYISKYSRQVQNMLKDCGIGGLIGNFDYIDEDTDCIEIDYNKYYTSILRDIKKIPVINGFDNFKDYDKHEIKDYNLYYVQKKDDKIEYPINHYSLCYGFNIKDITNNIHIIAYLEPSKLKTNIAEDLINEIYEDSTLETKMKKDIFNHCIGMFHKSYNKNTYANICTNREEALKYKHDYGGYIIPMKTDEITFYLNYIYVQKEITDGFKLISHMIYDTAHKKLFDLKKKVEDHGLKVLRCNTDCLYIEKSEKFDSFYNENLDIFDPAEVGKLKVSMKKISAESVTVIRKEKYERTNKRIIDLKNKFIEKGFNVLKCTDELLHIEKSDNFDEFYNENLNLFEKLLIKDVTRSRGSLLEIKKYNNVYYPMPKLITNEIIMKDERDIDEMKVILDSYQDVIIKADIAGAGKSHAFKAYFKNNNKKVLFICPWNTLCFKLKREGFDSETLDKVLGLIYNGDDFKQGKNFNVEEYESIVFEEIFLYDTFKLQKIKEFMEKHRKIRFYANGDENQNKPIETLSISNKKDYYNNIVSSMFPRFITFHDNKRCKDIEDAKKMKDITNKIRNAKTKKEAVDVLLNNFKIIYKKEDIKTEKNVCALNNTANWVNALIHKPLGGEVYYQGLDLICKKTYKAKNIKIVVNNTYTITDINSDIYEISDDGIETMYFSKEMLDNYFRLSYAQTCHSLQGDSVDIPITIFDINHFMVDNDWIYTAITRTTELNNINIYMGDSFNDEEKKLKNQIKYMIEGHKESDSNKNRMLKNNKYKYVSVDWTMNQLKTVKRCSMCFKSFDVSNFECFSIDRIDNNIGHYEFNCQIICRRCNVGKK